MTPAERKAALVERMVAAAEKTGTGVTYDAIEAALTVALEEAAKVTQSRYMGDNTREDMEARRIAAAINAWPQMKFCDAETIDGDVYPPVIYLPLPHEPRDE